jgi:hypothetical protein
MFVLLRSKAAKLTVQNPGFRTCRLLRFELDALGVDYSTGDRARAAGPLPFGERRTAAGQC